MNEQPVLMTDRLLLRPFTLKDAPVVRRLAGDYEVASRTLDIPYPYPDGAAEAWIATHKSEFRKGKSAVYAVTRIRERGSCGRGWACGDRPPSRAG
jgi:ribosomal-protein-alanine N-acetyltransferase